MFSYLRVNQLSQQYVAEDLVPLACDAGSLVKWLPKFRDYLVFSLFFSSIPIVKNLDIATKILSRKVEKGIHHFLSQCNIELLLLFAPQYCRSLHYVLAEVPLGITCLTVFFPFRLCCLFLSILLVHFSFCKHSHI